MGAGTSRALDPSMAGLGVIRQDFVVQPLSQLLEVAPSGRAESEESMNRLPVALTLAASEVVGGERFHGAADLRGGPPGRLRIALVVAVRKLAVDLHEFKLDGEAQPAFVCHARQQCRLVGGQYPQVPYVYIVPRLRYGQTCGE